MIAKLTKIAKELPQPFLRGLRGFVVFVINVVTGDVCTSYVD
jgi:hypothetical protein